MIEQISIKNLATYHDKTFCFKKYTFIYGSNGTGKSTLGNVFWDYAKKQIDSNNISIKTDECDDDIRVFNHKFVDEHFQDSLLDGIFTLGEDSLEKQTKIKEIDDKRTHYEDTLISLRKELEIAKKEKDTSEKNGEDFTWDNIYKGNKNIFGFVFLGKKTKATIFDFCLELKKETTDLLSKEELDQKIERFSSIQSSNHLAEPLILYTENPVIEQDEMELLKTPLISSGNSQIQSFFQALGNKEWVHEGLGYLEKSHGKCPFCGQDIKENNIKSIKAIFDEQYEKSLKHIADINDKFKNAIRDFDAIDYSNNSFVDDNLKIKIEDYKLHLLNFQHEIEKKLHNPSLSLSIEDYSQAYTDYKNEIDKINTEIQNRNTIIRNKKEAQDRLKNDATRYIANVFWSSADIKREVGKKRSYEKEIADKEEKIERNESTIHNLEEQRKAISSSMNSITKTIEKMNTLLQSFGFTSFYLKETSDRKHYQVFRHGIDEPVKNNLSDGEMNFISFLYFYCSLNGNFESANDGKNLIVFIDDPVSSLDSNVLFIVSSLISNLMKDFKDKDKNYQFILATHNLYFLQRIENIRKDVIRLDEQSYLYITLTKKDEVTKIAPSSDCPVKNTYSCLWRIIKRHDDYDCAVIYNTMRRIVMTYYSFVGTSNLYNAIKGINDEKEKELLRALVGSMNDGSHAVTDDFYFVSSNENIELLLDAFHQLFRATGQEQHYNLMMDTDENSQETKTK